MNIPQGPWYIDDLLTFTVTTHRFDTGALTDADAVPAYRVYEDETGTAILTGNMAKLDDANTTGFYSEQITLSAANGFEVGKSYNIYVTATVNSVGGGQSGGFKVIAATYPANVTQFGGSAGTFASGRPEVNTSHIAGSAVSTSSAQIGVNVVNAGGTAWGSGAITAASIAADAITAAKIADGAIDAGAIAADAFTAAKFPDATWQELIELFFSYNATGTYAGATAGSLVKEIADNAGGSSLTASEIADEVQTRTIAAVTTVGTVTTVSDKTGYRLSATGVDDVLDEAVEGAITLRQSVRLANAALGGKASGLETTTAVYRDLADSKDRISATVDADGNRTAVTRDLT